MVGILLLILGTVGLFGGLAMIYSGKRPLDIVGSLTAAAGIFLASLGGLRLLLPNFFS